VGHKAVGRSHVRTALPSRGQRRHPGPVWLPYPGDLLIASVTVPYEVRTEQASPRVLAAVRATTTPQRLSAEIIGLLDKVWPVLREQGTRTRHNVVVYHASEPGLLTIDAGVESECSPPAHDARGDVRDASRGRNAVSQRAAGRAR
jgi:hypothetical protein